MGRLASELSDKKTTTPAQAKIEPDQPASPLPEWSEADEAQFQELVARRKAAKVKRPTTSRQRVTDDTLLVAGPTKVIHEKSVLGVIKGLVTNVGEQGVTRADLARLMAEAEFASPDAKPTDTKWCQGWIAGALRSAVVQVRPAG